MGGQVKEVCGACIGFMMGFLSAWPSVDKFDHKLLQNNLSYFQSNLAGASCAKYRHIPVMFTCLNFRLVICYNLVLIVKDIEPGPHWLGTQAKLLASHNQYRLVMS